MRGVHVRQPGPAEPQRHHRELDIPARPWNGEDHRDRCAERDESGKALRLSILTGPREPDLAARQAALAKRLGPRLDDETRALLK